MNNFPNIKVSFVIVGKIIDFKQLYEEVNILPTETRGVNDWPKAIIDNVNLPEELQPRCIWSICQEAESCKQIDVPINNILVQIEGKEQKLFEFCKKNNLKKSLCITIHAKAMDFPEMVLPSNIVSYFGKLEVEIGFDIYAY